MKSMNNKAQLDTEVFTSPAFIILLALAWLATIAGYIMAKKWGLAAMPLWQMAIIMVVEVGAAYFFAIRAME
jgi:hypothetical protein